MNRLDRLTAQRDRALETYVDAKEIFLKAELALTKAKSKFRRAQKALAKYRAAEAIKKVAS